MLRNAARGTQAKKRKAPKRVRARSDGFCSVVDHFVSCHERSLQQGLSFQVALYSVQTSAKVWLAYTHITLRKIV